MTDSWRWPTVRAWPAPHHIPVIMKNCWGCTYKFERILNHYNSPPASSHRAKKIFNLMRLGFGEKRKQLASILTKKLEIRKEEIVDIFKRAGISPNARSENLGLDDWARLKQML